MTVEDRASTLNRVRDARESLHKARTAMDSVDSGLSAVESVAEKAESARRHPVWTGGIAFLAVIVAVGVFIGIRSLGD